MLLPRASTLVPKLSTVELLFPVLVVAVPVQLSPPEITIASPPGSITCELQRCRLEPLTSVMWLSSDGFQMS
jgi:hypothetical protein